MSLPSVHPLKDNRRLDWYLAWVGLAYGLHLLRPGASMDGAGHVLLTAWMSEWSWGALTTLVSVLHVVALVINGGQGWTPYARALINVGGWIVWGFVALGFWRVDDLTTALVPYASFALAHLYCGVAAVRDATRVTIAARRGRRPCTT